jgi:hypothetical protein
VDGTATANQIIAQTLTTQTPSPVAAPIGLLRMAPSASVAAPPPVAHVATAELVSPVAATAVKPAKLDAVGEFSLVRGIVGAVVGAAIGSGAMYAFYEWAGFRFPLLGVGIGFLTGLAAKLLARGTESTLGVICGGIALITVVGTLYLMYGEFPIMSIISVAVSVSVAYRISSG